MGPTSRLLSVLWNLDVAAPQKVRFAVTVVVMGRSAYMRFVHALRSGRLGFSGLLLA